MTNASFRTLWLLLGGLAICLIVGCDTSRTKPKTTLPALSGQPELLPAPPKAPKAPDEPPKPTEKPKKSEEGPPK